MKKALKWVAIVLAILLVAGLICGFAFNFDKVKDGFNKVKNDVEDTINDYLTGGETDPTEDNNDESSIGSVTLSLSRVTENDETSETISLKKEIWFDYDYSKPNTPYTTEYFQVEGGNYTPVNSSNSLLTLEIQDNEMNYCLKLESSTSVSFVVEERSNVYILSTAPSIKVDGSKVENSGIAKSGNSMYGRGDLYYFTLNVSYGKHVLTKDTTGCLYFMGVYDSDLYNEKGEQTYKSWYGTYLDVDPYFAEVSSSFDLNWVNPESEWARDKDMDDYVILKEITDTSVSVYCLQNFSESILLTATGEIYLGETSKEFITHCRIECVGEPIDYWNGNDKYVDSFEEEFYFDGFVVDNGTLAPSDIHASVYCAFVTRAGADYYPVYGLGFSANGWEASVFTLERMAYRCDEDAVITDLVNFYQEQGEIKADEYYKVLTFQCNAYVYFDEAADEGDAMPSAMGFKVNHDIYVRGSALLEWN